MTLVRLKPATGPWPALTGLIKFTVSKDRGKKQDICIPLLHSLSKGRCENSRRRTDSSALFRIRTIMGNSCLIHAFVLYAWSLGETDFENSALWSLFCLPVPLQHSGSCPSFSWAWNSGNPSLCRPGPHFYYLRFSHLEIFSSPFILLINCYWNVTALHGIYNFYKISEWRSVLFLVKLNYCFLDLPTVLPLCATPAHARVFLVSLEKGPKGNRGKSPVLGVRLSWVHAWTLSLSGYVPSSPFL